MRVGTIAALRARDSHSPFSLPRSISASSAAIRFCNKRLSVLVKVRTASLAPAPVQAVQQGYCNGSDGCGVGCGVATPHRRSAQSLRLVCVLFADAPQLSCKLLLGGRVRALECADPFLQRHSSLHPEQPRRAHGNAVLSNPQRSQTHLMRSYIGSVFALLPACPFSHLAVCWHCRQHAWTCVCTRAGTLFFAALTRAFQPCVV